MWLTSCLYDSLTSAVWSALIVIFLSRYGQACRQLAAGGTEPAACSWCHLQLNTRPSASSFASVGSPHWQTPHAWGLCLGGTSWSHTVLPARTDGWEPVSPALRHTHAHSLPPQRFPILFYLTLFANLWVGVDSSLPFCCPKQQHPLVVQGFS